MENEMADRKNYPDISGIIAAKKKRRFELAALSWEEKVGIVRQMQKLLPKGMWKNRIIEKGDTYQG
jgi:hypothetical protein